MTMKLLKQHVKRIANCNARVHPGQPFEINTAASIGDGVWQGDLGIEIVENIPPNYVPSKPMVQLVPGDTMGSRHRLEDISTVVDFSLPQDWHPENYDGLEGPAFVCKKNTTIEHPKHGAVIIAAGHCVLIRYQRNLDEITRRQRRALD